jgi:hypothetical protein
VPNQPPAIAIGGRVTDDRVISDEFHVFCREGGTGFSIESSADACKKHLVCKNGLCRFGAESQFSAPKTGEITIGAERINTLE